MNSKLGPGGARALPSVALATLVTFLGSSATAHIGWACAN
jgi:hypothetical protein